MEYDTAALRQRLADLSDEKYKAFNDSLIPGGRMSFGVRKPVLDKLPMRYWPAIGRDFLRPARGSITKSGCLWQWSPQVSSADRRKSWSG